MRQRRGGQVCVAKVLRVREGVDVWVQRGCEYSGRDPRRGFVPGIHWHLCLCHDDEASMNQP